MIEESYEDDYHRILRHDNGIIAYYVKETGDINQESIEAVLNVFNDLSNNNKFALLVDLRGLKAITREARNYMTDALKGRLYANALITDHGISKMMGNLILRFNKSDHPRRLFIDEEEAMKWLKGHLPL
jgi:hypothetical protein